MKIAFARAYAQSEDNITVIAVRDDAEIYDPDGRAYLYRRTDPPGKQWYYENFDFSIQDVFYFRPAESSGERPHYVLLSAEGDVYHFDPNVRYQEEIRTAGENGATTNYYGKTLTLNQIGEHLYSCGTGGQIYIRHGRNDWKILTEKLLYDRKARREHRKQAPAFDDPAYKDWVLNAALNPVSRNIIFWDIHGLSEDAIYLCGEEATKPVLCFWDGMELHELDSGLAEGALTSLYIESPDSIWICGREGLILHGNRRTGFRRIDAPTRHNLFHRIVPYRGKLVLPASVRPGGLWAYDPKTGAFGHFEPRLPRVTSRDDPDSIEGGPFFAQATGDVLWVVAEKDVFRFDGTEWERIEHPDI